MRDFKFWILAFFRELFAFIFCLTFQISVWFLGVLESIWTCKTASLAIYGTLQRNNTEKSKQIFPEKELRGLFSPNFHIHVSVSDLYIPMIGLLILLQENM